MKENIEIRGAREHNLKNIDLDLPREKLIVITGLSGSGKSTLAFDTIYAEGQRRYVESLSAYARQFLGLMDKPDVDSIEGLSPAISIEQKTTSKNPRSTVGTVTEIYDYLRLLYARVGTSVCPKCGTAIKPQSAENIVQSIMRDSGEIIILAPIIRGQKGTHEKVFDDLTRHGFTRVRIDGVIERLDELDVTLKRYEKHWIEAVVDRVRIEEEHRHRITEAVEHALMVGSGRVIILDPTAERSRGPKEIARGSGETLYTSYGACPNHPDIVFEALEPRMFSFNSPFGACPACHGIGEERTISPELLIPNPERSIADGAISLWGPGELTWRAQQVGAVGKAHGFDIFTPITKFTKKQRDVLLYGTSKTVTGRWNDGTRMNMRNGWEGLIPQTMRLYNDTQSDYRRDRIERFMVSIPCEACTGRRLKETVLSVHIDGKSIIDVTDMSVETSKRFFEELPKKLTERERAIAHQVLKEIEDRLTFLYNVGLGYLTLSRSARTLSGGEAQRIRLATQIGSNLMGVLYILDEPSIGLHQRDNEKLITTLKRLRDLGNTLIVVEHDEDTMRSADWIIDMGPGAGAHGGHIAAQGTPTQIEASGSLTADYLRGTRRIDVPSQRREAKGAIRIEGAQENNLKNVTADIPLGVMVAITGVSGSGKSTLVSQTLMPALRNRFGSTDRVGTHRKLTLPEHVTSTLVIDQDPIGRTPRSNPATYTKLFDDVRALFAGTKEARKRGYKAGRFSFNVSGGRCETCQGDGMIKIEMNFLPDVYVTCEDCKGKRYNRETLEVLYKGKTIADVLDMTVEEASEFFAHHTPLKRKLDTLLDVGLDYIKLGQSSTTLSGGESQRIKLTRELSKYKRGHTVYFLDEPTTGLHFHDVKKLIAVLNRLVDNSNTVIIIEHNLDVIKSADWVIDLGPEGGDAGGRVIATGTPESITKAKRSHTGRFLKKML
ncbi:MAG: excinuclease ABC subunit UvrA [Candidatus Woesearchaeota archaeon]